MIHGSFQALEVLLRLVGQPPAIAACQGLAALEDLDGFADLPAAVKRDCQSMLTSAKHNFVRRCGRVNDH